jgi:isopenicillin N synthase-like dioxygenase
MNSMITEPAGPARMAMLAQSLHATGFATLHLSAHSATMLDDISREWLAFFGSVSKRRYLSEPGSQDGYFPHLAEDDVAGRDRKEYFHVRPTGRYPAEVSDAALRLYAAASELGSELLGVLQAALPEAIRAALPIPLPAMVRGSDRSVLRVQHYLPVAAAVDQQTQLRAAPHRDVNLLTLLPAPTHPGLQIRDPRGAWRSAPHEPRTLIINGGLMLARATRGYYPAVEHRVVHPAGAGPGSRISLPLFLQPRADVPLDDDLTASAFLRRHVAELRERGWRPVPGGH